ncbi:MAG: hypothetical protein JNK82_26095 [Myxococcaceae bacterium]|nr:hypothetical protein [Myxococcaceae bacterium]
MRWPLALVVLVGSGCTCLFNPDRVGLPCDPVVPPPLDIVAGEGTSLTFEWPRDPARDDITEYELCWGATSCRKVQPRTCDAGQCATRVDGPDAGFRYNERVEARVTMKNQCGDVSAPSTASATPLNGTFIDTQGIEVISRCDAGIRVLSPGELTFDQNAFLCVSTAMMGDEQWRDATIDLEVRIAQGDALGGIGVRAVRDGGDTAPRNGVIVTASPNGSASAYLTRRVALNATDGTDVIAATAVPFVRGNDWEAMRVSVAGEWFSVELGDDTLSRREVMRWRDRSTPRPGRVGVALGTIFGGGRIDVRNLRVRTSASIPDGGSDRDLFTFSGANPLRGIRPVGNGVTPAACPPFTGPAPDAGCLEVTMNGTATVEAPIGLDYNKPWRVRFKYGAELAANGPSILRTTVVAPTPAGLNGFSGFSLIDAAGVNWALPLRAFEDNANGLGTLTPGTWNVFEVAFAPGSNDYTISRNGMVARSGKQPPGLSQHLGALQLGGGAQRGYFADVEILQDP